MAIAIQWCIYNIYLSIAHLKAWIVELQDKLDNLGNESLVEQHSFSSQNESFQEATLIAILADKFGLKKFKKK